MNQLPDAFINRLEKIIPDQDFEKALGSFAQARPLSLRINTLKISIEEARDQLKKMDIVYSQCPWYDAVLLIDLRFAAALKESSFIKEGLFYIQGLSSMLPPLLLNPQRGERILDMCAAPGSKTTQIAALMHNEGQLVCVEHIKNRYYRLKSVVALLGVEITQLKLMDARRFRDHSGFDRILVDAPCSSEGRFSLERKVSYQYWSLRKIKEMARKQKGLLLNAARLLKPQGTLIYSTCTFAPEENEGVVDWLLRKTDGSLRAEDCQIKGVKTYPPILQWGKKVFDERVGGCMRVLPTADIEGFFIAKFTKMY